MSTQEQASEGVSLDAQRDRLTAYCKMNGIKLIDIKADEGISGSTLERPGLQVALQMLKRGRANTLLVAKLDRLSRSLRDVCALVDDFSGDERYHLLSLCGMVNTHSAAGRMVLMNLANYNQFEREVISERTRDALRHIMAHGVRLGPAPYGYEFSHEVDGNGRRLLVPLTDEQDVLRKIRGNVWELACLEYQTGPEWKLIAWGIDEESACFQPHSSEQAARAAFRSSPEPEVHRPH